ncbi:chemotaxis protein CheX [Desulfobotulus alkaliphilus]|uniref:Chemotaxis protein CheX n=1 Tax=Desulfobotulus alkaliphilus TaxID=622671 RepID=A0A562RS58_9BACT|nr:chemotaxis protein CheX [Desulfobotulus alkaliphilus]TWI71180.1 chemotaxis protein CheX [Desulfobotulus alkaliphilus]
MDASLINPFIEAGLKVMKTTATLDGRTQAPYIKKNKKCLGPVTGCIRMTGSPKISIALSFSESCILTVVSRMFGEELTEINDEIKDAVGEMMNMICGQVNNTFGQSGISRKAAFEQVLSGPDHLVEHGEEGPVLAVPIKTESGDFFIEILFQQS